MQDRIRVIADNLKEKWQGLERQQKMRLVLGIVCLAIALGVTLFFAFRPEWYTLYANKDFDMLSKAHTVLNEAGIKNELRDNSTSLMVLKKDEFAARAALNGDPEIAGTTSFVFEDMFQNVGFGVSESVKKYMSNVAMQNEIAESLKKMYAVSDASVFLNVPDTSGIIFRDAPQSSASIFITQSATIDSAKAEAMADYVSTAIQGLEKKNITITNQYMETLYSGAYQGSSSLSGDYEMELKRKNEIDSKVFMTVRPFFDDAKVLSNIVVNTDKIQQERRDLIPTGDDVNTGIITRSTTLTENATSSGTGAEPGTGSNDATSGSYQMENQTGSSNATRKESDITYDVSSSTTYIQEGYGNLVADQSSVSVTGYRYRFFNQVYMEENNLLNGQTWVEFKESKTAQMPARIEVDPGILETLRTGTGIENISLVAYEMYYFQDAEIVPVDWQLIVVFAILALLIAMLAIGLLRQAQPEEVLEVDPELSVEDLLVSTQLEEEKEEEAERERLRNINYTADSEVKKQIDKFVEEKPEAVAQLLRSWLNEGWE